MTPKEMVIEKIKALPDDAGIEEIRQRLDFILGVQEALDSSERGETIPKSEVKSMIKRWATQ